MNKTAYTVNGYDKITGEKKGQAGLYWDREMAERTLADVIAEGFEPQLDWKVEEEA